ncbi:putative Zinc finger, FYVE/PHD-type, START-like domain superfamily [Plasmopara halstedii]
MVQQYSYSRSPDHPYALEMLPLPRKDRDNLFSEAKATYQSLFPAVKAAVRLGNDGEIFTLAQRSECDYKSVAMWTTSVVYGTLEEVADLYLDRSGRVPMNLDSARSRRLYEIVSPSRSKPLHCVSMRWSLWKPPSKLSNGRDVCFLEYMDSFVDSKTGRRVWARSMRSINHLCCPASQHPDGPIRTYMRVSGMILRETDHPNVLKHVTFIHIDNKGASNWVAQQAIVATKKSADCLNHVLKIMRQLNVRQCRSCGDRTSRWSIAKRCRFCENILCKKCVDIRYRRFDASGTNHRICLPCAVSTGPVKFTNHSLNLIDYNQRCRYKTQPRHDTVIENRDLFDTARNASSERNRHQFYATQTSGCSKCSTSMTESFGGSSIEGRRFAAHSNVSNRPLFSLTGGGVPISSATRMRSAAHEWDPLYPDTHLFTLDARTKPFRGEPIDLSYLDELITPRAGATRRAVGLLENLTYV